MKGLVVAAGFAAGISGWADSAQNSFIIISGDADFSQVDDDKILVKGPRGDKRLTYQGREGWGPSNPQSINLPSGGAVKIPVWGLDGENDKNIEIQDDPKDEEDKCTCSTNMVSQHASDPAIGPRVKTADVVAIYSYPEIGVPVPKAIEWMPISNCVHDVYKVISACKKCGTEEQKIFVKEEKTPPGPKYDEDCDAEGAVKGADGRDYLPYGRHHVKYTASWKSSDCRENKCRCGAEGDREYFVYLAGLTSPEYIGLDMTDEGKKTWKEYEASASITPDEDRSKTVSWELVSKVSVFEDGTTETKTDGEPVKFGGLKANPKPSEKYRGETIRAIVTLPDAKGGNGSATVTNAFTVVKVDVEIASTRNCVNVKEEKEEKVGTFISFERDVGNTSAFTKRGLESLAEVKFSIFPKDIPEDQVVKLKFDDGFLFEVEKKNRYKQAEHTYSLKDLREKEFVLHGHKASENVRDREIEIVHVASGAKDVAKYTVVEMELVPDFDRNGVMDAYDTDRLSNLKTFHWWINDDADGDDCGSCYRDLGTELPGFGERKRNYTDKKVNGRADILDFFPLWANVSQAVKLGDIDADLKVAINGIGIAYAYTGEDNKNAKKYLSTDVVSLDTSAFFDDDKLFESELIKDAVKYLPKSFLALYGSADKNKGLLIVEANAEKSDVSVRLYHGEDKVLEMPLKCEFCNVMDMIDELDLWGANGGMKKFTAKKIEDPEFCDADVDVVYIHGFKIKEDYSRGWSSDAFKRLYQSGCNARFTGVTWPGYLDKDGDCGLHYHEGVYNAFLSAKHFADFLNGRKDKRSKLVVMAHSLGNIVVSSALCDHGLSCDSYYLLNAAVASEAYSSVAQSEKFPLDTRLVHKDWKREEDGFSYPRESYCTEWYRLFDRAKGTARYSRADLTWRGRFESITSRCRQVVNYYSSEDEVFDLTPSTELWMGSGFKFYFGYVDPRFEPWFGKLSIDLSQYCWQKQEIAKGVVSPLNLQRCCDYAGWGFCLEGETHKWSPLEAYDCLLSGKSGVWRRDPVFSHNPVEIFECKDDKSEKELFTREELDKWLAYAVPAGSPAMGRYARAPDGVVMSDIVGFKNGWGRNDHNQAWLHCDIKDMGYFYTYKLWDEFVERGGLK